MSLKNDKKPKNNTSQHSSGEQDQETQWIASTEILKPDAAHTQIKPTAQKVKPTAQKSNPIIKQSCWLMCRIILMLQQWVSLRLPLISLLSRVLTTRNPRYTPNF